MINMQPMLFDCMSVVRWKQFCDTRGVELTAVAVTEPERAALYKEVRDMAFETTGTAVAEVRSLTIHGVRVTRKVTT